MKNINRYRAIGSLALLSAALPLSAQLRVGTPATGPLAICGRLSVSSGTPVAGYIADKYVWGDSTCSTRSTSLVNTQDKGGHAKQFTYKLSDGTTRVVGESGDGWAAGFGYIVSHLADPGITNGDDDSPLGSGDQAASRTVFAGKHHAIHEFTLNYPRWGVDPATGAARKYSMPVTIHWLFATGRDYPLWAVTFDLSGAPANAINADTRAPYGDMNFDGAPAHTWGSEIAGVIWGDRYQFQSNDFPFTLNSSWSWTQRNTGAPYNALFTANGAEMGIVGTTTIAHEDAGGYSWGPPGRGTSDQPCWNEGHKMPCTSYWSFQSVNYSFGGNDETTASKRLAWGADWGYLGQSSVNTVNGNPVIGWPRVSYSTYIVLGQHSLHPTQKMAQQAAAISATQLTTPVGYVAYSGSAGINRNDTMQYSIAGYNPVYGAWEAYADNGKATLNFAVAAGNTLKNPLIMLRSYWGSETPTVKLNGVALLADKDYFATYRQDTHELWITLKGSLSGNQSLAISN